jgi:hypothetical protein
MSVEAHWVETTIGERGTLTLENLPFEGRPVEVLVLSRTVSPTADRKPALRGSVLEYRDPFEPVAISDWEALG